MALRLVQSERFKITGPKVPDNLCLRASSLHLPILVFLRATLSDITCYFSVGQRNFPGEKQISCKRIDYCVF